MKVNEKEKNNSETVELNELIANFIDWFYETELKDSLVSKEEHENHGLLWKLRNFIDNMAVWYELKYPCPYIYFSDDPDLTQSFENTKQKKNIDWEENYSTDKFIETSRFTYFYFIRLLEVIGHDAGIVIKLTRDGLIKKSWGFWRFKPYIDDDYVNKNFNGKHVSTLVELFEKLAEDNPDDKTDDKILNHYRDFLIKKYNYLCQFREGLLNSVMYRIIERDRAPYRALLFAKEFNLNIDIPLKYTVNPDNCPAYELSNIIKNYINLGGHKDLVCFTNYFSRKNKDEKLETMTIEELSNIANEKNKKLKIE